MRCLYETLGVEPSADYATIKAAYRREALRNHPDKNPGDALAEERFKEVQNAYEILSDDNERAWYDSHRDAILRSGQRHQSGASGGDTRMERPDDWVDVYAYHTSACYDGFNDGPRGFYTVYDYLFEKLAEQELHAAHSRAERKGIPSHSERLPRFGNSSTPGKDVMAFYVAWSSFVSSRNFDWADEYNLASAPNRRVRRAMEQENEKRRRAARREYHEGVRGLVEFLKKRDKRVVSYQMEEARKRQEREAAENERRRKEREDRLDRARAYKAADWMESAQSDSESSDVVSEPQSVWHCPACDKYFKSEASFANHERSKKHKELLELLILQLQAEEDEVLLETGSNTARAKQLDEEERDEPIIRTDDIHGDKTNRKSSSRKEGVDFDQMNGTVEERCDAPLHYGVNRDKEMASARQADNGDTASESQESEFEDAELDEDAILSRLLESQANLGKRHESNTDSGSQESPQQIVENSKLVQRSKPESVDMDDFEKKTSMKNRKSRRGRKKTLTSNSKSMGSSGGKDDSQSTNNYMSTKAASKSQHVATEGTCNTCGLFFSSRNQLFKHLKQTGHAQRI